MRTGRPKTILKWNADEERAGAPRAHRAGLRRRTG